MVLDISNAATLLLTIIIVAIWLWALYDIIFVNTISTSEKLFWVVIIIVFNFIGVIFYVLLARKESDYKIVKRK